MTERGLTHTRQIITFALLGAILFCSKLVMEFLPNFHLIGALTVVYTIVYRRRALIPLYIFVLLTGLYAGFNVWWIPYLYIWTVLWGAVMLLPRRMKPAVAIPVYSAVCALHGLAYGTLYAPAQMVMFHLSLPAALTWIAAGLPWDALHAVGNLVASVLIWPLSRLLLRLEHTDF